MKCAYFSVIGIYPANVLLPRHLFLLFVQHTPVMLQLVIDESTEFVTMLFSKFWVRLLFLLLVGLPTPLLNIQVDASACSVHGE